MTPAQKQALQYLTNVANDYAGTLAPSVRGPFVAECQEAFQILNEEPAAPVVATDAKTKTK